MATKPESIVIAGGYSLAIKRSKPLASGVIQRRTPDGWTPVGVFKEHISGGIVLTATRFLNASEEDTFIATGAEEVGLTMDHGDELDRLAAVKWFLDLLLGRDVG